MARKIAVYVVQEGNQTFEGRPDLEKKTERVIKLFRGSPTAFEIWKKSNGIPANAQIIEE